MIPSQNNERGCAMKIAKLWTTVLAIPLLFGCDQHKPAEPKQAAAGCWRLYAANELSDDITVIDEPSHKVVGTVKVGKRPRGMAISGNTLYIALSGWPIAGPATDEDKLPAPDKSADGIGVFDTAQMKIVKVLHGVSNPEQLAISPDGSMVYSPDEDAAVVHFIGTDGSDHGAVKVAPEPEGVAISPDGKQLYVTSEGGGTVTIIDTASQKVVKSFSAGDRPRSVTFSPDGKRAYVSSELGGQLIAIDTATQSMTAKTPITGDAPKPMGLAVATDGKAVFVSTGRGGTLVRVNQDGSQKAVAVGARPWGIALSPDGKLVYTANGQSNDLTIVAGGDMKEVGRIKSGGRPWGVKVGPAPPGTACKVTNH